MIGSLRVENTCTLPYLFGQSYDECFFFVHSISIVCIIFSHLDDANIDGNPSLTGTIIYVSTAQKNTTLSGEFLWPGL